VRQECSCESGRCYRRSERSYGGKLGEDDWSYVGLRKIEGVRKGRTIGEDKLS
jgi:hypothetical protein